MVPGFLGFTSCCFFFGFARASNWLVLSGGSCFEKNKRPQAIMVGEA